MDSKGTQVTTARSRPARLLRWPLLASLLLHGLGLGAALWWALGADAPTQPTTIGSIALRPVHEPEVVVADDEPVEPPPLEETFAFADALAHAVREHAPDEPEPLFQDDSAVVLEPPTFREVPLTAARRPRPAPPPPTPVVRPRMPAPRPRVVHVRPVPPRPLPPPPRVASSPARRTPLRVVWAPDPRRYYPASAMRSGLGGRALVRLTIDARGRVTSARVERTSGHAVLDRAAVSLAYAYRFTTGATARTTRLPVTFRPPGGGFGS